VLATSLLDTAAFPAALFADLYRRRRGIETDYRRLKQTLSLENTSGRTVCAVQQDIHAGQLLKNLAFLMQVLQQPDIERKTAHRKLAWKANFTQGVSRLKHTLVAVLVRPSREALDNLLTLIGNCLSAVRPGRRWPRHQTSTAFNKTSRQTVLATGRMTLALNTAETTPPRRKLPPCRSLMRASC